jgi:hypothetical protein
MSAGMLIKKEEQVEQVHKIEVEFHQSDWHRVGRRGIGDRFWCPGIVRHRRHGPVCRGTPQR